LATVIACLKPFGPESLSVTVTVVEMLTSLWFGGHKLFGVTVQFTTGNLASPA
jgi:hypothetical protein